MITHVYSVYDIKKFDPYNTLRDFMDDEYFEDRYLEYFNNFKVQVDNLKERLDNQYDKKIDDIFSDVISERNDEEINRIIREYSPTKETNERDISLLKKRVRLVKDIILASEKANMKRLQKIDNMVGQLIDSRTVSFDTEQSERVLINKLIDSFNSYEEISLDDYGECVSLFKKRIEEIYERYRKNYSVKTATKKIKELNSEIDRVIDNRALQSGFLKLDQDFLEYLIYKYKLQGYRDFDYDKWNASFRKEIEEFKNSVLKRYSSKMAKEIIALLDEKTGLLIDSFAKKDGFPLAHEKILETIFDSYRPENLDIFDIELYGSEEERILAIQKYKKMDLEEKRVFEMRMYDQYVRIFKRRIREFNKDLRQIYSLKYANKCIDFVNKKADKLIRDKAVMIGRPVPKNPWFVRKYLWADTTNFLSEDGIKFRKFINPFMREVVKLGMNNKIIIEERPELDPTKQYIFVSTHYFTEDVIGLFSSLGRQAYMVMGTTDQIENNPLMMFAVCLGFLHVDRMDSINRKEAFEKQNEVIEHGTNFINYVSGSWENSENELQPLSFSGPYRTGKLKNVEIVPVGSYLVSERNEMYVRFGEPMDLTKVSEKDANEIIRDTLASMHYKQLEKHSVSIGSVNIPGYGLTHDLPYDQHTYYMNERGNEYWNQPWSRPFAKEEIGVRTKKDVTLEQVYEFIDNLSRDKLIELSSQLAEPLVRIDEKERYDIVSYIDNHYEQFKKNNSKKKAKKQRKSS